MAYRANPRMDQVYIQAAIWAETLVYGFYVCLFILAMYIITKRSPTANSPREPTSTASKVFFAVLWLMFTNATFHIVIIVYRLIRAYGFILSPTGAPIDYFIKVPVGWDSIISPILMGMQIWFGDALAIYRCYIIWGHNFWIIIVPILLNLATMAVNITLYAWFSKPWTPYENMTGVIDAGYPLALVQNVLTTGLIAWKIWWQHRASKASGLKAANRITLIHITRIIVESASVYTLQALILNILYFLGHPLQFVFQAIIVPTIGIVFLLIAIRVHIARSESQSNTMASSIIPPWLSDQEQVLVSTPSSGQTDSSDSSSHSPLQLFARRKNTNGLFSHRGQGESEPKTDSIHAT